MGVETIWKVEGPDLTGGTCSEVYEQQLKYIAKKWGGAGVPLAPWFQHHCKVLSIKGKNYFVQDF